MNKTLFLTAVIIFAVVASWFFNQWPLETLGALLVLAAIGFAIEAIYTKTTTIKSEVSNWIDVENNLSEADYWDGDETDKNPN